MINNHKKILLLMSICAVALLPTVNTLAQQSDSAIVATTDATVTLSNSTMVDVTLDVGSSTRKIAAFTLFLTYDDSIINVTDCLIDDYNGVCNETVSGEVRLTGLDINGIGNKSIAATLTVEGVATGSAAIEISAITTLIDSTGQSFEYTLDAGQIDVVAPATATNTPEPTATNTPVPTATNTPEPTATNTPVPTATNTPEPTATSTPVPTATNTPEPTATSTPSPPQSSSVVTQKLPTMSSNGAFVYLPLIE